MLFRQMWSRVWGLKNEGPVCTQKVKKCFKNKKIKKYYVRFNNIIIIMYTVLYDVSNAAISTCSGGRPLGEYGVQAAREQFDRFLLFLRGRCRRHTPHRRFQVRKCAFSSVIFGANQPVIKFKGNHIIIQGAGFFSKF